ncbi:MAG: hypothetical protein ACOVQH_10120 [Burkholderiaceae bacterium]|jgi:hypothetical protein
MFDLNSELERWRRNFSKDSRLDPDEMAELESHLIELFDSSVKSGIPESAAFFKAIQDIGDPQTLTTEYEKTRPTSSRRLWRAFWIAPLVAPVMLAIDVFVVGSLFSDPVDAGTPIGIIAIPLMALTLGTLLSYVIAGTLWMPLAFFLQKRGWLNGMSIHSMGFGFAIALYALFEVAIYFITTPRPNDIIEFMSSSIYIAGFVIPNIMLSVVAFWWLIREKPARQNSLDVC